MKFWLSFPIIKPLHKSNNTLVVLYKAVRNFDGVFYYNRRNSNASPVFRYGGWDWCPQSYLRDTRSLSEHGWSLKYPKLWDTRKKVGIKNNLYLWGMENNILHKDKKNFVVIINFEEKQRISAKTKTRTRASSRFEAVCAMCYRLPQTVISCYKPSSYQIILYWTSIAKQLSRQVLILYPIGCKVYT